MPLLQHNDMWHRDASFIRTREVLGKLGTSHVGFVAGPGYEDPGGGRRYENQFLLAPIVIKTNPAEEPFVLVGFGANNPTVPMPGLILVEDFQNGFALFRKAQ
jgi:hypothetical protein